MPKVEVEMIDITTKTENEVNEVPQEEINEEMSVDEAQPSESMEDESCESLIQDDIEDPQSFCEQKESSLRAYIHQTEAPKKIEYVNPSEQSYVSPNDSEKLSIVDQYLKQKDESYEPVIQDIVIK